MYFPSEAVIGQIEEFGHGITREFLDDGQIVIVTRTGATTQENVDTWFNTVLETYRCWEPGRPMLLISDMSDPAQGITTYSRQRAQEFARYLRQGVSLYMAIVLNNAVMVNMMNLLMRGMGHSSRAFVKRDEALAWLRRVALGRTQL